MVRHLVESWATAKAAIGPERTEAAEAAASATAAAAAAATTSADGHLNAPACCVAVVAAFVAVGVGVAVAGGGGAGVVGVAEFVVSTTTALLLPPLFWTFWLGVLGGPWPPPRLLLTTPTLDEGNQG